jgi:hypothetical protein
VYHADGGHALLHGNVDCMLVVEDVLEGAYEGTRSLHLVHSPGMAGIPKKPVKKEEGVEVAAAAAAADIKDIKLSPGVAPSFSRRSKDLFPSCLRARMLWDWCSQLKNSRLSDHRETTTLVECHIDRRTLAALCPLLSSSLLSSHFLIFRLHSSLPSPHLFFCRLLSFRPTSPTSSFPFFRFFALRLSLCLGFGLAWHVVLLTCLSNLSQNRTF